MMTKPSRKCEDCRELHYNLHLSYRLMVSTHVPNVYDVLQFLVGIFSTNTAHVAKGHIQTVSPMGAISIRVVVGSADQTKPKSK